MRHALILVALGLVACSSVDPTPNLGGSFVPAPVEEGAAIPKETVERDLSLEVTRTASEGIDHERDPALSVWLVNRSPTASYPIVLANDGSESGMREPHAFFGIVGLRPSGKWEPLAPSRGLRCGNYAEDWSKDVVTLAPGGRVKMPWMPYPSQDELGDATKVRIVARYEYGEHARDKTKVPPVLHAMPAYALQSAPIEIPVERPYSIKLEIKGALPTTPNTTIASAVDVIVENRSRRTLPVGNSETGAQLWFEVKLAGGSIQQVESLFTNTTPTYPSKETLAAGARTSIVTPTTKTDVVWTLPSSKIVQMRALWRIWDGHDETANGRRVESAWVDVP